MPLIGFDLNVFDDFSYSSHFFVKICILEFEECLCHFLLFSVLHVDVNEEKAKGYRSYRNDNKSDCEVRFDLGDSFRPLFFTIGKSLYPGFHNGVKIVLNLLLVLSLSGLIWSHQYSIQSRRNLNVKHIKPILTYYVTKVGLIVEILIT